MDAFSNNLISGPGHEMDSDSDEEESCSSDEELDEGEETEDEEEIFQDNQSNEASVNASQRLSDGDDGKDYCPICLNSFYEQDLGVPENCEHVFCFECIYEWSQNINTCPIDRTEFNTIHLHASGKRKIIKKVKVHLRPKEPEDMLEEVSTLCEICHSGDREDRLLLCDGCDLAYHCECLDPPLFYIPIEEWFCPSCSGIVQSRYFAGPSRSTSRRVIPRTRASEAVRSRVQNRRTRNASTSRSTSVSSRSSGAAIKKKRHGGYRRTIKKVVRLARTKQSMSNVEKGKVGVRGETVIITYRKSRRRRKRKAAKSSVKSAAVSKALASAQTRIAKRLGISKPLEGSALPQVKKATWSKGQCLGSGGSSKTPCHSIFGDKNQLMDFSENFNEDNTHIPSTSGVCTTKKKILEVSTAPPANILDSIMAGQTLLHSKSDNIVIKTDGSLILKTEDTKISKSSLSCDIANSGRTPMKIALAKEGVKSQNVSSGKNTTQNKVEKIKPELSFLTKESSASFGISQRHVNKSKSKLLSTKPDRGSILSDSEKQGKSSLWKLLKKPIKTSKQFPIDDEISNLTQGCADTIPSDWEAELTSPVNVETLKRVMKIEKGDGFVSAKSLYVSQHSSEKSKITSTKGFKGIKNDSNSESQFSKMKKNIKAEVTSDLDSNMVPQNLSFETKNELDGLKTLCTKIKEEPKDSSTDSDTLDGLNFANEAAPDTSESNDSDCDASQSLISSRHSDILSCLNESKIHKVRVKKEVTSSDEELSQFSSSNNEPYEMNHNLFITKSSELKQKKLEQPKNCKDVLSQSLLDLPETQVSKGFDHKLDNVVECKNSMHLNFSSKNINKNKPSYQSHYEFDSVASSSRTITEKQKSLNSNSVDNQSDESISELPATQIFQQSCDDDDNKNSSSDDELPATQINSVFFEPFTAEGPLNQKPLDKSETQIFTISNENSFTSKSDVSKTCRFNHAAFKNHELSNIPATQIFNTTCNVDDLNHSDDELSETQLDSKFIKFPPDRKASSKKPSDKSRPKIFTVSSKKSTVKGILVSKKGSSKRGTIQNQKLSDLPETQTFNKDYDTIDKLYSVKKLSPIQTGLFTQISTKNFQENADSDDEIPATQKNSDFINIFPVRDTSFAKPSDKLKSKASSNFQNKEWSSNGSTRQKGKSFDLPSTQISNNSCNIYENFGLDEELPLTQIDQNRNMVDIDETQVLYNDLDIKEDKNLAELPCTQQTSRLDEPLLVRDVSTKNVFNKNLETNQRNAVITNCFPSEISGHEKYLKCNNEIADLPATQTLINLEHKNSDNEIPNTQSHSDKMFSPKGIPIQHTKRSNVSDIILNSEIKRDYDSLPLTQVSYVLQKPANIRPDEKSEQKIITLSGYEISDQDADDDLPLTQLNVDFQKFGPDWSTLALTSKGENDELPATQINSINEHVVKPETQSLVLDSSSLHQSNFQTSTAVEKITGMNLASPLKQTCDTCFDTNSALCESQLNSPVNDSLTKSDKHEQMLNENFPLSPDDSVPNIRDILSNIKELVNNLSKSASNVSMQKDNPKAPVSDSKIPSETSDQDKAKNAGSRKENSAKCDGVTNEPLVINNYDKIANDNSVVVKSSDSENIDMSLEKLELLTKAPSKKDVGIHKHLPQVITTKPVKLLVQPKPSNRKTFSFQQVARRESLSAVGKTDQSIDKDSVNEVSSRCKNLSENDIRDTQTTQEVSDNCSKNVSKEHEKADVSSSTAETNNSNVSQYSANNLTENYLERNKKILENKQKTLQSRMEELGDKSKGLNNFMGRNNNCMFPVKVKSIEKDKYVLKNNEGILPSLIKDADEKNKFHLVEKKVKKEPHDSLGYTNSNLSHAETNVLPQSSLASFFNIKKEPVDCEEFTVEESKVSSDDTTLKPSLKIKCEESSSNSWKDNKPTSVLFDDERAEKLIKLKVPESHYDNMENVNPIFLKTSGISVDIITHPCAEISTISIKKEKSYDYLTNLNCSEVDINQPNDIIAIKTEANFDELPATQISCAQQPMIDHLPSTQKVPCSKKKPRKDLLNELPDSTLSETLASGGTSSDDEISIIEVKSPSKVKAVILIDDDEEEKNLDFTVIDNMEDKPEYEKSWKSRYEEASVSKLKEMYSRSKNVEQNVSDNLNLHKKVEVNCTLKKQKDKAHSLEHRKSLDEHPKYFKSNHTKEKHSNSSSKCENSKSVFPESDLSKSSPPKKYSTDKNLDSNQKHRSFSYRYSSDRSKSKDSSKELTKLHRNLHSENSSCVLETKKSKSEHSKSKLNHKDSEDEYLNSKSNRYGQNYKHSSQKSKQRDSKRENSSSHHRVSDIEHSNSKIKGSKIKYSKLDSNDDKDSNDNHLRYSKSNSAHRKVGSKNSNTKLKHKEYKSDSTLNSKEKILDGDTISKSKHNDSFNKNSKGNSNRKNSDGQDSSFRLKHRDSIKDHSNDNFKVQENQKPFKHHSSEHKKIDYRDSDSECSTSKSKSRDSKNVYSKSPSSLRHSKDEYSDTKNTNSPLKNKTSKYSKISGKCFKHNSEHEISDNDSTKFDSKTSKELSKSHSHHRVSKADYSKSYLQQEMPEDKCLESSEIKSSKLNKTTKNKKLDKHSCSFKETEDVSVPHKKLKRSSDIKKNGKCIKTENSQQEKLLDVEFALPKKDLLNFQQIQSDLLTSSPFEKIQANATEKEAVNYSQSNDAYENHLIPLSKKRKHELIDDCPNAKKSTFEDCFNSVSCSNVSFQKDSIPNKDLCHQMGFSDSNDSFLRDSPMITSTTDMIKVVRKQELKEEIANEVKMVLKPFFTTGLITKDDYKEIMRKAVPKIFINCHNCINPEKIQKLVLGYVSLLNKTS